MTNLKDMLLADPRVTKAFERGQAFVNSHHDRLNSYRSAVQGRLEVALREFRLFLRIDGVDIEELKRLKNDACEYLTWLGWSLDDACYFATAFELNPGIFARRLVACHFLYQAGRMLDDVIDGHLDYKGLKRTLLGRALDRRGTSERSEIEQQITLLALVLLLRGVGDYVASYGSVAVTAHVRRLLTRASQACVGALVELELDEPTDPERYEALVAFKSASHNAILLQAFAGLIDDKRFDQLEAFGRTSSQLGQILNDAQDLTEDASIGQINRFRRSDGSLPEAVLTEDDAKEVGREFHKLLDAIDHYAMELQDPCYGKFATAIHKAEQIVVATDLLMRRQS